MAYTQSVAPIKSRYDTTTSKDEDVELVEASELRIGKYCMMEGFPCRIRATKRSAPGKHGHAKLRTVGTGVLDDKKRNTICGTYDVVHVPIVEKFSRLPCVPTAERGRLKWTPSTTCFDDFPSCICQKLTAM